MAKIANFGPMNNKGLILVNLGSPDSLAVSDVKKYLRQFLMDERVIDAPYLIRMMIVEGFVLPFRPKKSAEAYASVWTEKGSPLRVLTEDFRQALKPLVKLPVAVAMRYGNPTPQKALADLLEEVPFLNELWIAPMYPHYAMSSYETALVYVQEEIEKVTPGMKVKVLQPFYNETNYVDALVKSIRPYLNEPFDHLLFSYHGLPVRHLKKTDPTKSHCYSNSDCCSVKSSAWSFCYKHQVIETTKLTAAALQLDEKKFSYSFQSRLGRDEWIKPFTVERLQNLPKEGVKKLLVVCPAFVSDCLETLEEMAIRGRETFLEAGGESFQLIPCLNSSPVWVETFAKYCNQSEDKYQELWKLRLVTTSVRDIFYRIGFPALEVPPKPKGPTHQPAY